MLGSHLCSVHLQPLCLTSLPCARCDSIVPLVHSLCGDHQSISSLLYNLAFKKLEQMRLKSLSLSLHKAVSKNKAQALIDKEIQQWHHQRPRWERSCCTSLRSSILIVCSLLLPMRISSTAESASLIREAYLHTNLNTGTNHPPWICLRPLCIRRNRKRCNN